jgi:predicted DNA-binding transcriptional regulator YafY
MNNKWPIRWDLLFRYRLIEIIALWEGRLTTNHLIQGFGICRQQASKDINSYLTDIAPGNLEYDKSLKGYRPANNFKPVLTSAHVEEYLHIIARSEDMSFTFSNINMGFENTLSIHPVSRSIPPEIARPIIQAIIEKKRVDISYTSLKDGEVVERLISPHTLICTPLRWHVRAYCEHSQGYRDFVLSRITGIPSIDSKAVMNKKNDTIWGTAIVVKLVPDMRFNPKQAAVIAKDYGMIDNMLSVPTNAALIRYVLDSYSISLHSLTRKPQEQQLDVANWDEISNYL